MGLSNWEIARYLIEAKKNIDSLAFVAKHQQDLADVLQLRISKKVKELRDDFYINAATVVDNYIESKPHGDRKKVKADLKNDYPLIGKLFYFRDKHAAHKDSDFIDEEYDSLWDIIRQCRDILGTVRNVCSEVIPVKVTLDYVYFDSDLFRALNHITKAKEEEIKQRKYPLYNTNHNIEESNAVIFKIFHDTEDIRKISNPNEYCVVMEDGLTWDEGIQKRQDACIKVNVKDGTDWWMHPVAKEKRALLMARKLGYFDKYGCLINVKKTDSEIEADKQLVEDAEKYRVFDI